MNILNRPVSRGEKLRQMQAFTNLYRTFPETEPYQREVACLRTQFSFILQSIRPDDLLAGRMTLLPVGFMPQPAMERGQGVGYYCDEELLQEWASDPNLTLEEQRILWELIHYWKHNTTKARTERLYSADQWRYMTHGNYRALPGAAYPLYRISGTQLDFCKLLENGLNGLRTLLQQQSSRNPAFFSAADDALALIQEICLAYAASADAQQKECCALRQAQLQEMGASLRRLAVGPPQTFRDAVQLVHLYTLLSGSFNYGRMDEYLTPFYARDIAAGRLDKQQGKELLRALWKCMQDRNLMMDARVILGGKGRHVPDPSMADEFALVVMEVSHEVHDTLPQLTLMCDRNLSPLLWHKAMDMLADGTTYPILYNDERNIPAVANAFSVSEIEVQDYIPFGCGEYVLYHKSIGTPSGTLNLLSLLNQCLTTGLRSDRYPFQQSQIPAICYYKTFDEFYAYYLDELTFLTSLLAQQQKQEYQACAQQAGFLLFSVLFDDCIERGLPLLSGGVHHLGGTLETYGNTNTADSLCAIKTLVYDQKRIAPQQLLDALQTNFDGYDSLRALLLHAPKYGNDDVQADGVAVRLHEDLCRIVRSHAARYGLDSYLVVIINNRTNTFFGQTTGASPDGRLANTFMANANNPVGGMDRNGLTAMLNSLCKLTPALHAGAVQNMRFTHQAFGELRPKTEQLLQTYFECGGTQAMITVLGRGDLEAAVKDPDSYRDLIVRVGGFSARFVELLPAVQQELISRTLY